GPVDGLPDLEWQPRPLPLPPREGLEALAQPGQAPLPPLPLHAAYLRDLAARGWGRHSVAPAAARARQYRSVLPTPTGTSNRNAMRSPWRVWTVTSCWGGKASGDALLRPSPCCRLRLLIFRPIPSNRRRSK